jgi:hypothetical protein
MGVVTLKQIQQWIREGRGQGHFENYLAWLRVTRRNGSKISAQSVGRIPLYRRRFDFMADGEMLLVLLLLWLGARDVREQYPAWPWAHPHPLADYPHLNGRQFGIVAGLWEIAEAAGIRHGYFVGTDLPYVATIDILATVDTTHSLRLVALGSKPGELIEASTPQDRLAERLKLQEHYSTAIGAAWLTADRGLIPRQFEANLKALCPYVETVERFSSDPRFDEYRSIVTEAATELPPNEASRLAAKRIGWQDHLATQALHLMIWRQDIDLDITRPLLLSQRARPGGRQIRQLLQRRILGEVL